VLASVIDTSKKLIKKKQEKEMKVKQFLEEADDEPSS